MRRKAKSFSSIPQQERVHGASKMYLSRVLVNTHTHTHISNNLIALSPSDTDTWRRLASSAAGKGRGLLLS